MTYGEIFARYVSEHPSQAHEIKDYRPSDFPNSIIVWSERKHLQTISLVHYSEVADIVFIISDYNILT